MPLALAQGSNKAERLPALDPARKGSVKGASNSRISRSVVLNYTHPHQFQMQQVSILPDSKQSAKEFEGKPEVKS
jgi:hypothetical protein